MPDFSGTDPALDRVGNIVTAGMQLYRLRFRTYLKQALWAHLWLIIPINGDRHVSVLANDKSCVVLFPALPPGRF